jgi:hypothetical protein
MTPFEYAWSYANLKIADTKMGIGFTTRIWMYVSGGNSVVKTEYNKIMSSVAKLLGLGGPSLVPDTFFIPGSSLVSSVEPFYKQGIRRAFAGRGLGGGCLFRSRFGGGFHRRLGRCRSGGFRSCFFAGCHELILCSF